MLKELESYLCTLDDVDKRMIDNNVAEKGIEKYLSQQLIYLDCSRVINDMRMMQTIGYPYQREISSYLYALETVSGNDFDFDKEWIDKLLERHQANLEYEKENPPIWYGGKKAKEKWLKDYGVDIDGCMRIEDYEHSIKNALDIKQKMQARKGYCACYLSNDIGAYNSCPHLCKYCYANGNKELILKNYKNHDDNSPLLIGHLNPEDKVREAKQESYKKEILLF